MLKPDEEEHLAIVVVYLTLTGRISEAADILKQAPRLRRAMLRLAALLLTDVVAESEEE